MQKNIDRDAPDPGYREQLTPSLWIIGAAAVGAPMTALAFTPVGSTLALALGGLVAVAIVAALLALSPGVEVANGQLRAGRARIPVEYLGTPVPLTGEQARHARGPGLDRSAWHLFRGGIDPLVVVPVTDPDDPTSSWVISSRTPDRLAAAIQRAQRVRLRTPDK